MPSGRFRGGVKDRPWRRRAAEAVVTAGGNAIAPGLGTGLVSAYEFGRKAYNLYSGIKSVAGNPFAREWAGYLLKKASGGGHQPTLTDFNAKPSKMVDQRMRSRSASRTRTRGRARSRSVSSRRPRRAFAPGRYVGVIRPPKPVKPPGKYALYGYSHERDVYGDHSQNECNILGVRSVVPFEAARAVGIAVIRHIMRKNYGQDYSDEKMPLLGGLLFQATYTGTVNNNPATFVGIHQAPDTANERWRSGSGVDGITPKYLVFFRESSDSGVVSIPTTTTTANPPVTTPNSRFAFTENVTVAQFGDWFAENIVLKGEFGSAANKDFSLKGYQLIDADAYQTWAAGDTRDTILRPRAFVPIDRMYIKVLSTVSFNIQNITQAAIDSGDRRDGDRIDSNPVVGKMMKFSTTLPRVRDVRRLGTLGYGGNVANGNNVVSDASIVSDTTFVRDGGSASIPDGVLKGVTPTVLTELRSAPRADYFYNVTGEGPVSLQPGEIKKFNITFKYDGTLVKFIHGWYEQLQGTNYCTVNNHLDDQFGTCALFFLEQRIRNGSGEVQLAFEAHRFTAARVKKVGRIAMNKAASDVNIGNL